MSNYSRGRAFEYAVRDDMRGRGFVAVRSPASKSPADVYCMSRDMDVLIQCKADGRLPPKEWNDFMDYCDKAGAIPVLAMRDNRGRGIVYKLLTDRKRRGGRQPMVDWIPPEKESR